MLPHTPLIPAKAGIQFGPIDTAPRRWVPAFAGTNEADVVRGPTASEMTLEDDMAFFEQVPVLAGLGRQALRVLAIGADTKHLPSGAVLHYAGEVPDAAYIVQRGSLLIDPGTFSEGQQYTVGPGTLIGELTLITEHVVPATAIAREPTVLIRLPRSLFRKMLEGYPSAADKLREMLASRLIATTRELNAVKRKLDKK